jgi:hypothetical protein
LFTPYIASIIESGGDDLGIKRIKEEELRELVMQFLKYALQAYNLGRISRKEYIDITERKCRYMQKIMTL